MASDALLSVVIPVYRSERYLATTVGELVQALDHADLTFEIVLVNDGSPDEVHAVIDALSSADPRVRGLELGRNRGQHAATLRGFAETRGDVVVTIDDDGQNPPSAAIAVMNALVEGDLDVAYGEFRTVEQSRVRRVASAANAWLTARTLHNEAGIAISNVRAIRGELARAMAASTSPYPYIDALVFRMTCRIGHVSIEHRARSSSGSTYTFRKLVSLWVSHLTTLSVFPLKVAVVGSLSASVLGFAFGVAQLVRALVVGGAPAGWLSLFCAVTFLFSILFAFLGIISAYLGRMYVAMNERELIWIRTRARGVRPADGAAPDARRASS
jgi:undecaprenyl-phosphate 4-deoxy-4-formamido-L-arabinose transferase